MPERVDELLSDVRLLVRGVLVVKDVALECVDETLDDVGCFHVGADESAKIRRKG